VRYHPVNSSSENAVSSPDYIASSDRVIDE
jgi:hypothetical protein